MHEIQASRQRGGGGGGGLISLYYYRTADHSVDTYMTLRAALSPPLCINGYLRI